ncbi:TPA: LPXTG cell wall anchor domain-containing protein [Streptococcus agalactiae]|uniref:LPXTG cell wall anchor domain-containing protein n=1 Tax=Streptococcus anginosus TaxID=1328 RepID=UPI002ABA9FE5|nr:LPXTG cell wall anchor domain-containing protein [Streptococcus agalactiae]HEN9135923.1 LPXTG cell wall anchor domain-containing protein [Streptococcus agalactiae]HEO4923529.1 LPXTG cell wall anchor domain-containing protein [Streptococcus agalactiae]HEO8335390.1 LPXTG cell wall anchor domain-containing protein [Streptococcus agalactiae]
MTKKQLLTLLTVSALALSQAGFVSADEVAPVDPSAPSTEVVVPPTDSTPPATDTGSSDTGTTQPTVPVDPSTPSTPTEPSTPTDPSTSDPVVPTNPSTPGTSTEPSDNNGNNGHPTTPGTTNPSTNGNGGTNPTSPSEEPKNPAPMPEPNQTFDPFETNGGQTVVGTQNSQVVVQQADGSTNLVSAESIGGRTNADGTVTLTSASGEMKKLPETGEAAGGLLSLIGAMLLGTVGFIKKKYI